MTINLQLSTILTVLLVFVALALGVGTLWANAGLLGSVASGCPYTGTIANAEYFSLTGCSSIPLDSAVAGNCDPGHFHGKLVPP